ncbi:BON domain-containing protein [Piscinibacter sakaiensis]|uniref:BON domain-containing protein n=1 Tax=Piscinibacter sakaiensis TaxID=1547922 RepID=UPI003AACDB88
MNSQSTNRLRTTMLATAAAAALLLSACGNRDEERTAGQQIDSAVATAEQKSDQASTEIREQVADAQQATREATADLKQSASNAAEAVSDKVHDAAITASVNAELAKDSALSALKIDVDTVNGKVSLRGTAPNSEARERATRLAANVKGVVDVQNNLEVRS